MICISCNAEHHSQFCPNCGEKSAIKKITLKSIAEDTLATVTTMDKGFLYNFKMLFINPKTISIGYVLGRRKGILNPISFLIFTVSIYLILERLIEIPKDPTVEELLPDFYAGKVAYATGKYVHVYFKYFWVSAIVPLAIATRLIFAKYNFTEHLAINAFILGQASLIGIISYLVLRIDMVVNPLVYLTVFWLIYRALLVDEEKIESFLKALGALVVFVLQLAIIALIVGLIMA